MKSTLLAACSIVGLIAFGVSVTAYGLSLTSPIEGMALIVGSAALTIWAAGSIQD